MKTQKWLLIAYMSIASTAMANTWIVDDDGKADFTNIQTAVDAATNGDEIIVRPGTYTSTAQQVVDFLGKTITLRSSHGANATFIDGENIRRCVVFTSGETVLTVLDGFTLTRGNTESSSKFGGGGIFCSTSSPTIENCTISDNTSNGLFFGGGGILCTDYSSPLISNCLITNNYAGASFDGGGGGVSIGDYSNPTFNTCTISGNTTLNSKPGGGVYIINNCHPEFISTRIMNNSGYTGGGIYCGVDSDFNITGGAITDNTATTDGGGVLCDQHGQGSVMYPSFYSCTVNSNTAGGSGGGAHFTGANEPMFYECFIIENTAQSTSGSGGGGGIYYASSSEFYSPTLSLIHCEIDINESQSRGGGILCSGFHNTNLEYSRFTNNTAVLGGGISIYGSLLATITDCKIQYNSATDDGGGLHHQPADGIPQWDEPVLARNLFCSNTPNQISGVYNDNGDNVIAEDCCPADITGDAVVDVNDLLAVIDQWGSTDSPADIYADGIVDVNDLLMVVGNWGGCP